MTPAASHGFATNTPPASNAAQLAVSRCAPLPSQWEDAKTESARWRFTTTEASTIQSAASAQHPKASNAAQLALPGRAPLSPREDGLAGDSGGISIGGVTPFTTIDFPGRLAAVVFCRGCPWRCGYCHNTHLQSPHKTQESARSWGDWLDWLDSRRGLLDGVVFSGGEPLLQRGLGAAINQVRQMGFAVGLHSAGIYPQRLAGLLPMLQWVGLDIKGPFEDYQKITGTKGAASAEAARASLAMVASCGIDFEVRCTVDAALLDAAALSRLGQQLASQGVRKLVLQPCRHGNQVQRIAPDLIAAASQHLAQVEVRQA